MVLSRREQIIGLVTAGVLGLLALDHVALSPLLERRASAESNLRAAEADAMRADQLLQNAPRMLTRWKGMKDAGLKSDATESKSQALRKLLEWERESGITFTSLQPDRGDIGATASRKNKDFQQITLRASGTGSMRQVSRFLWQVQTSEIPMRITDLQIDARKPGSDDLMITLAVSTLALAPAPEAKPAVATGPEGTP